MSRNALVASLAGALALGLSAFSAQAASVPMSDAGIQSGSLVQKAHSRYDRHYRSNRSHRFSRYFRFQRHYRERDHRANRHDRHRRWW